MAEWTRLVCLLLQFYVASCMQAVSVASDGEVSLEDGKVQHSHSTDTDSVAVTSNGDILHEEAVDTAEDSERVLLSSRSGEDDEGVVTTIHCEGKDACKDKTIKIEKSHTVVRCIGKDACSGNTKMVQVNGAKHVLIVCDGEAACKGNFRVKPKVSADDDWTVSCYAGKDVCQDAKMQGATKCSGPICPTTLAGVSAYSVSADTKECMIKTLCFNTLPANVQNNNAFKCECVWRKGASSEDPMCAAYNKCLDSQRGEKGIMARTIKNIEAAIFGHKASLLQLAPNLTKGRNKEDPVGCIDPFVATIEELTCSCWAHLRAKCEALEGDAQVACWRHLMCTHSAICPSWQTSYCTKEERAAPQQLAKENQEEAATDEAPMQNRALPQGGAGLPEPAALDDAIADKRDSECSE